MKKPINKNIVLFLQYLFISRMGTQLFLIALLIRIKDSTNSSIMLGAIAGDLAIAFGLFCGFFGFGFSERELSA